MNLPLRGIGGETTISQLVAQPAKMLNIPHLNFDYPALSRPCRALRRWSRPHRSWSTGPYRCALLTGRPAMVGVELPPPSIPPRCHHNVDRNFETHCSWVLFLLPAA